MLQGERRRKISLSGAQIVDFCDTKESLRAVLTTDGHLIRCNNETEDWICDVGRIVANETGGDSKPTDWFRVYYASASESLLCLSRSGAVVAVELDNVEGELVGEFENGLFASAWDGEVLLLVTSAEEEDGVKRTVLLTMNSEWQVLAEVDLEAPHDSSQPVFVAIRPSDSSLCAVSSVDQTDGIRKVRIYKTTDLELQGLGRTEDGSGKLAPNLQAAPLAWAGMGCSQILATLQKKGRSKTQVAFFEPNGLRHGEFLIPDVGNETSEVIELCWNAESSLLAVAIQNESPIPSKIQLWYRCNYHWYLKREILCVSHLARVLFHPENPNLLFVALKGGRWIEYELNWRTSAMAWPCTALVVDGSSVKVTPLDRAVTPPPMSEASITFPVSVSEVAIANRHLESLSAVIMLVDGSLVVLHDENSGGRTMSGWKPPTSSQTFRVSDDCPIDPLSLRSIAISSAGAENVELVAACLTKEEKECLVALKISCGGSSSAVLVQDLIFPDSPILTLAAWSDAPGAMVELNDGSLFEYLDGQLVPAAAEPFLEPCHWIEACKIVPENEHGHNRLVVGKTLKGRLYCHDILLAETVTSFLLSVSQGYLCYVSADSQFQLRFVHLSELASFDPLLGSEEHQRVLSTGYEPRDVERGASLVCVRPEQPVAVLQMPRGNLEAVYPRALVLRYCMHNVAARQRYRETYELMRRQKVDLNLIVDIDPQYFLKEGIQMLIDQVHNLDHLNLFISSLQNWNSTAERYPVPKWIQKEEALVSNEFDFTTKVNMICENMRSAMLSAEAGGKTSSGRSVKDGHFLLPILSTFAKQDPPQIEDALKLIKYNTERQRDSLPKNKPILFSDKAQSAIQYLAFMADYSLLFDRALGQYDFDMARAIARNSQMDPKVYLPLLKRYNELPFYYSRYEVDLRLKKYEAALRHLAQSLNKGESLEGVSKSHEEDCPDVGNTAEDCMLLIEKHGLYRLGLELFQDPQSSRKILIALGDNLMKQKKPETALNVFLTVTPLDVERAKSAAKSCRDWKTLFSVTSVNDDSFSVERRQMLAREVADNLCFASESESGASRRQNLSDAARVLYDYGNDVSGAVDILLRAEMWMEAQRISVLHSLDSRRSLDAVVTYAQKTIEDLEEKSATFQISIARFDEVVKIRREAVASGEVDNEEVDQEDNGSLFSTASTTLSNASVRSSGTSASLSSVISVKSTTSFSLSGADEHSRHRSKFNQRGQQQKKKKQKKNKGRTKIRPGSQAELMELVGTLRSCCLDNFYSETIADTVCFLFRNHRISLARALFESYGTLSTTVATSLSKRKEVDESDRRAYESRVRREGFDGRPFVTLEVEKEVHDLMVPSLPQTLMDFFEFIPEEGMST